MKKLFFIFSLLVIFSCSSTITVVKDIRTNDIQYHLDSISKVRNLSPMAFDVFASDTTLDTIYYYTIYNKGKAVGTFRYEKMDSIYVVRIIDNDVKMKKK